LWRFCRRGPKIEFFHYNDFPFVNLYPLYRFPFRQGLSATDECG
jgi:hypothetical protein